MSSPRQKPFGPTQKDIGLALNLAQSTVAVGLNPKLRSRLPLGTVKLIEEKAAELGYRPQKMARVLRNGRSHTIGAIYRMGVYHAPQSHVRYLAQCAFRKGYQLFPLDLEWFSSGRAATFDEGEMRIAEDYLLGSAIEGVVFCNLYTTRVWDAALVEFCRKRNIHGISLNCADLTNDEIRADRANGFYQLTRHHMERGARRLVLQLPFYDRNCLPRAKAGNRVVYQFSVQARIDGFIKAIEEAGGCIIADRHPPPLSSFPRKPRKASDIIGEISYMEWPEGVHDAFELGDYALNQSLESKAGLPDSFVCSNDQIAAGVLAACIRRGIRIPDDLMVSGADDSPISHFCGVPLTTIAQPSERLAERSIERLVSLIEKPEERHSPIFEEYPCQLIARKSTLRL